MCLSPGTQPFIYRVRKEGKNQNESNDIYCGCDIDKFRYMNKNTQNHRKADASY